MLERRVIAICLAASALSLPAAEAPCDPTFTGLPVFDVSPNGGTSALADLNRDGRLDLTTGFRCFLGDGAGGFPQSFELDLGGGDAFDVAVRDFDGDGLADLALASVHSDEIILLFGRETPGDPTQLFGAPVCMSTVDTSWHIACPDVNEDGRPDIVAVGPGRPELAVHVNNGDRTFADPVFIPMGAPGHPIATGDFDGDGHEDIAVGCGDMATLLFGRGDARFGDAILGFLATPLGRSNAHRFRTADLDGDGRSELLAVGEDAVLIYLGTDIDPDLGLPPVCSLYRTFGGSGRFLEVADLNGDGVLDLALQTAAERISYVRVYGGSRETGEMSFVAGNSFPTELPGHGSVLAVGDVNGDARPDVVITTEDTGEGRVFLNDGNCAGPLFADPGDANADGAIDLGDPIAILTYLFGQQPLRCEPAGELNGDGRVDLADPIYLLTYLFAQGPPPPPGGPLDCRG